MPTHILLREWIANGQVLSQQEAVTADSEVNADIAVPDSSVNLESDLTINHTNLKSLFILSDQDLTLKTNSTSAPSQTINVPANLPVMWSALSLLTSPISADITKLFLSNASGFDATFRLRALVDSTP